MSKPIIVVVFGALLILCIGAQVVSLNNTNIKATVTERLAATH